MRELSTQQRICLLELILGYVAPCADAARGLCLYCNIGYATREPWDCPNLQEGPWDQEALVLRLIAQYLNEKLAELKE